FLFIAINGTALLVNLIDTGYYKFSNKRSGLELFMQKNDIAGLGLSYLKDYWYLAVILFAAVFLMNRVYPRLYDKDRNYTPFSFRAFFIETALIIPVAAACFIGARGGWQLKPINTFDAARFARPELVSLTVNTPF